MALSEYAVFLAWAAAALVVYAAAAVANRRGWGSVDYRPQAAVVLLTGLLAQRASAPKLGESRGPEAGVAEAEAAAGRAPGVAPYVPLLIVAVCIPCVVLVTCVVMVVVVKLVPAPPPPPPQSAPARRYSERRRA
ncbi:unnamed protein product [Urochloa decumbens]|uniref:Uncharacterized protein n=1 Tax=Urochloa decumbens TaxID=240449 RepID=A0ABC9BR65_9POAL